MIFSIVAAIDYQKYKNFVIFLIFSNIYFVLLFELVTLDYLSTKSITTLIEEDAR